MKINIYFAYFSFLAYQRSAQLLYEMLDTFRSFESLSNRIFLDYCQNQLSHPSLSHIEQARQDRLIQQFDLRFEQNLNKGRQYL